MTAPQIQESPLGPPAASSRSFMLPIDIRKSSFLRLLIIVLTLNLQISSVLTDSLSCFTLNSTSTGNQCKICQSSSSFACNETTSNKTVKVLGRADCYSECCNSNMFDNTNQFYFCTNQYSYYDSNNASTLSLATILIIIFFSIPAGICILIAICTCINNRRYTEQAGLELQLSAVNLANFNIEELGPLYQDKTTSCSICLEPDCNLRTKCGHSYHSQCLKAWIHKKQKCPLCVTQDFNPIILYCVNCFKQAKMVVLMDNMSTDEAIQWSKFGEKKCEECFLNHLNDVISLDFSIAEENDERNQDKKGQKEQKGQKKSGIAQVSQSNERVVVNQ